MRARRVHYKTCRARARYWLAQMVLRARAHHVKCSSVTSASPRSFCTFLRPRARRQRAGGTSELSRHGGAATRATLARGAGGRRDTLHAHRAAGGALLRSSSWPVTTVLLSCAAAPSLLLKCLLCALQTHCACAVRGVALRASTQQQCSAVYASSAGLPRRWCALAPAGSHLRALRRALPLVCAPADAQRSLFCPFRASAHA